MNMTPEEAKSKLSKYAPYPFREFQEEAIEFCCNSDKRFVFLEAPTGSGKSLLSMASGVAMGGTTYAVHSKTLQHQITADFPEARSLFGRSNYVCLANPVTNCDNCFHTKYTPCKLKKTDCTYEQAKLSTLSANLRILNYDYLLGEANYVGRFSNGHFNIIDEADNLEATLINFTTLTFTNYALDKLGVASLAEKLQKTSKDSDKLISQWSDFAFAAKEKAGNILKSLTYRISNITDATSPSPDELYVLKEHSRVTKLSERIKLFLDNMDSSWVLDDSQSNRLIFRPLWLTPELAEKFMWRHSERWVLMSASFLPVHLEARRLGISEDEIDYKCLPSTFPIERRPIHIEAAANLTAKTMDEEVPKLITRITEIIELYPNVKGMIHAVSFSLAAKIMEGVNSPRLITHSPTNRQEILQQFMDSPDPLVLISPSMTRGVNLEHDLCRFVIMAKAPFLSLGDKITAARMYSSKLGKEWYNSVMLLDVLQATGRGMRGADDYCASYILDAQFKRVFESRPLYLPEWWRNAVTW
jgi:Rad3-related DNA helicase